MYTKEMNKLRKIVHQVGLFTRLFQVKAPKIHNSLSPASNTLFRAAASSVILPAHILPSSVEISMNFTSYTARMPLVVWLKTCKHYNVTFPFNLLK